MPQFSIATQIDDDLKDFFTTRVKMANIHNLADEGVRFAKQKATGYMFSQAETLTIIDLYYNSKFRNGERDNLQQKKIFLNVGKFRSDVASKQIELDSKDFRFEPDPYADPFTAFFLEKDFHEWAKMRRVDDFDDASLGDVINTWVDKFPRYGTIVGKKVGNTLRDVPLQNLRNEQTARSLQVARYVIEEHDLYGSEIMDMAAEMGWDLGGVQLKFNKKYKVYERYGHVPMAWLQAVRKAQFGEEPVVKIAGDSPRSQDAVVVMTKEAGKNGNDTHIFYANSIGAEGRPFREKHWSRQHGRWMGVGVMEDLIENQDAKNIVVNLNRRSLHWAAKRIGQSNTTDEVGKNLVTDVPDGTILEVGPNGEIKMLDLSNKSLGEFQQFMNEFEKNSDQKAFTYEANIMNSGGARTAFRLAAFLTQAAQAHFKKKQQFLAMFVRDCITDFFLPQFLTDMGDEQKVVSMMSGERGFEAIKDAVMDIVQTEATRVSLLSGKAIDTSGLMSAISPFEAARVVFSTVSADRYKTAKYKFDFVATDDNDDLVDRKGEVSNLTTLYQAMSAVGDKRAEAVLERIAELGGINMDSFPSPSPTGSPDDQPTQTTPTPSPIQQNSQQVAA